MVTVSPTLPALVRRGFEVAVAPAEKPQGMVVAAAAKDYIWAVFHGRRHMSELETRRTNPEYAKRMAVAGVEDALRGLAEINRCLSLGVRNRDIAATALDDAVRALRRVKEVVSSEISHPSQSVCPYL
jgi:hypothetical protein